MNTQLIHRKYATLLAEFGIQASIETTCGPDHPAQEVIEENGCFLIRLNPSKFNPDVSYEAYLEYNARKILLPRLVLETERLILRRFRMEDAPDCFALLSDEAGAYMDCCKAFPEMDEAFHRQMELFAQQETRYMIELKSTEKVVGTINLFEDNSRAVEAMEIGYGITPGYQRRGYAYEALSALIHLLQNRLQLEMIVAGTLPENIPSEKLLKKLGFHPEGIHHKAVWHEGLNRPVDLQYYYIDKP